MPTWGNTDANTAKPHFPDMRQVRLSATAIVANTGAVGGVAAGNTVITVTNSTGVAVGQFVYGGGPGVVSGTGQRDFFKSNNTVVSIQAGTFGTSNIVLTNAVTATVLNGTVLTFDTAIVYNTANTVANTFADTILVTPGRMANTFGTTYGSGSTVANTRIGNINQGWNRIQRKINNDGTIRFLKETLIALANTVASNTSSANTSANAIFGGL
jgi:hypothetical protein